MQTDWISVPYNTLNYGIAFLTVLELHLSLIQLKCHVIDRQQYPHTRLSWFKDKKTHPLSLTQVFSLA